MDEIWGSLKGKKVPTVKKKFGHVTLKKFPFECFEKKVLISETIIKENVFDENESFLVM